VTELSEQDIHGLLSGAIEEKIEALESFMLECEQVEIPVSDSVTNGMYTREIIIPKGTLLTGRVHKYPYVDIMLSGDITVAIPGGVKRLVGANVCDGIPGRKRAGYAHEDTRWVTVHRTDRIELEEMIEHLTFFSMTEFRRWDDHQDFMLMVEESGFTQQQIRDQSEYEGDRIDIDLDGLKVAPSFVDGDGVFATLDFDAGHTIAVARINEQRTQVGRYTNHSKRPNCRMIGHENGDIYLESIRRIKAGEEITVNYRQVRSIA
jgi:hypothetical protein